MRDRFFGSLSWLGDIRVVPGLRKILLVRVDAGVNKEAIQQWTTFEGAMRTASRDGYGDVIPGVLLQNANRRTTQPDNEVVDVDIVGAVGAFDDRGVHQSQIDENGHSRQPAVSE